MAVTLELRGNNLYRNGSIVEFDNREMLLIRERIAITDDLIKRYHVVKDSDELTVLAHKEYSAIVSDASKYWWAIADANIEIVNPLDLSHLVGKRIAIPDISKVLLLIQ